jgi:hypothetical protein
MFHDLKASQTEAEQFYCKSFALKFLFRQLFFFSPSSSADYPIKLSSIVIYGWGRLLIASGAVFITLYFVFKLSISLSVCPWLAFPA